MNIVLTITIIGSLFGAVIGYFAPYFRGIQFPIGFGLIGVVLGICCLGKIQLHKNRFVNFVTTILMFALGGIAYAVMLNASFEMPIGFHELPFASLLIPLAAATFVFVFCLSILSLKFSIKKILILLTYIGLTLVVATSLFFYYKWSSFILAHFLVLVSMILITIAFFAKDTYKNLLNNFLLLFALLLGLPAIIPQNLIPNGTYVGNTLIFIVFVASTLTIIGNIIFIIAKLDENYSGKVILEWLVSFFSIIVNYTIVGAIFCILPYFRTSNYLKIMNHISPNDVRICSILAFSTFLINCIFMFMWDSILSGIWRGAFSNQEQFLNTCLWLFCSGLASYSISKSVFQLYSDYQ